MEKNFESRRMHDLPPLEGIPSLWSGRLNRASALLIVSGLWMMVKSN